MTPDTFEPFGPRQIVVICQCSGDRVNENAVRMTNIEEDIQGRDVVTFQCPLCGQQHKSLRLG